MTPAQRGRADATGEQLRGVWGAGGPLVLLTALVAGGLPPGAVTEGVGGARAAAVLGVLAGGLLALASMSTGPFVVRWSSGRGPGAVMGAAVGGYGLTVLVLGAAFVALADRAWAADPHVAAGLAAGVVGAVSGQVRAALRSRVPVVVPRGAETGGDAPGDGLSRREPGPPR